MAKRVNAKKEKAKRNKINARKYRKSNSKSGGGRRRRYNDTEQKPKDTENSSNQNSTDAKTPES